MQDGQSTSDGAFVALRDGVIPQELGRVVRAEAEKLREEFEDPLLGRVAAGEVCAFGDRRLPCRAPVPVRCQDGAPAICAGTAEPVSIFRYWGLLDISTLLNGTLSLCCHSEYPTHGILWTGERWNVRWERMECAVAAASARQAEMKPATPRRVDHNGSW